MHSEYRGQEQHCEPHVEDIQNTRNTHAAADWHTEHNIILRYWTIRTQNPDSTKHVGYTEAAVIKVPIAPNSSVVKAMSNMPIYLFIFFCFAHIHVYTSAVQTHHARKCILLALIWWSRCYCANNHCSIWRQYQVDVIEHHWTAWQ